MKKLEDKKDLIFPHMCRLKGWKEKGWKNLLFDWEEKWEDGKWSLYKFIVISLLDKTKSNTLCFYLKNCVWMDTLGTQNCFLRKKNKN